MASKPPQKVNLYSLPELRSAVDEAIPDYLTTLPKPYAFAQDHAYPNVRLALGYTAVLIAGALFAVDWKYGWEVTKPYTLPACVAYFLLNGAMTLWIWAVESGTIFQGRREGGQKLKLASHVQKPNPEYILTTTYSSPQGDKVWQNSVTSIPFAHLFNVHGFLQKKELHKFLAKKIEVVGLADPKSKAARMEWQVEAGEGLEVVEQPDRDSGEDAIEVVPPSGAGAAAAATPSKRGPGRPKKKA
ncbi:Signal peptidase complex subunit SPC2 [Cyphellophora attinorum]|uniref:Signal peptidase complex subunit 2 n=1 Tax=Cyphellophora attinorum TaxID=1664694 RepID=A0A0N1HH09_9EURO|nr:Signal peptidase complex subunit SPC2 [Phialophora attinorum]KPI45090.1 Signal peptidase complex subunit SPC2 [Phialophora attinorum]